MHAEEGCICELEHCKNTMKNKLTRKDRVTYGSIRSLVVRLKHFVHNEYTSPTRDEGELGVTSFQIKEID